ncbi:hypothetical protein GWK47_031956 [Chionoecetes opilio]|uniref:Uncharacterized protein n=1 Tax=Chionoecetes opilio TaxID=41210 RepID=A0A8J5CQC0_CHIOP|nr:hypothetical protein GWK47_031956 [Chionoecetes opilio]
MPPSSSSREHGSDKPNTDTPSDASSSSLRCCESSGVRASPESVPLTHATLTAKDKFMRPLRGRDRTDLHVTFSESETESDQISGGVKRKRKKKRRQKRNSRGRKAKATSKKTDPNMTELAKTDVFSDDIINELLKLYVPRQQKTKQKAKQKDEAEQRKRKRKRKGGKRSDERRKENRDDLLISLTRNTAFWYDVTSRLKVVSGGGNDHSMTSTTTLPSLPPTTTTTRKFKEAVMSDSVDSGLGGEKQRPRRRSRRAPKKKAEEGGLDDPGQTAVGAAGDSRAASSRLSASSHSSKPTSGRSSKSSSSHRRMHDPLSYHPKSIRVERMLVEDFSHALGDALGGTLDGAQLGRLTDLLPLPREALDKDFFVLVAAFAERFFCYELLAAPDVEVEARDLVEQLDFRHLEERLAGVELEHRLHRLLMTVRDLG